MKHYNIEVDEKVFNFIEKYKNVYKDLGILYDAAYWRLQRDEEDYFNDQLKLYILKVGNLSKEISLCLALEKGIRLLTENTFEEIKYIVSASITDKKTNKNKKIKFIHRPKPIDFILYSQFIIQFILLLNTENIAAHSSCY